MHTNRLTLVLITQQERVCVGERLFATFVWNQYIFDRLESQLFQLDTCNDIGFGILRLISGSASLASTKSHLEQDFTNCHHKASIFFQLSSKIEMFLLCGFYI